VIPVDRIIPGNPYSQDDAAFLMGCAFTKDAAKEAICEACRSGQLKASKWRNRWWFTGNAFVEWVARWFGAGIDEESACEKDKGSHLARILSLDDDGAAKRKPVAVRKEVDR